MQITKRVVLPIVLFFMIVFIPINAMAYPVQYGVDSAISIILQTPEIIVSTPNFDKEGKINVNVKFENEGSGPYHGLIWKLEPLPYPNDIEKSLDEIYRDNLGIERIGLVISDITDPTPIKLDRTLFKVTSDYNLLATSDHKEGFSQALQLNVLDIEQNVIGEFTKKSSLEFSFTLSSPEFELGKKYQINLFTSAAIHGDSKTFEFVDRINKPIKETPKETPPTKPIETSAEEKMRQQQEQNRQYQEQQKLQAEQALKDHAERKRLAELEKQKELESQESIITSEQVNSQDSKLIPEPIPEPEPTTQQEYTPEPIMEAEPVSKSLKCGKGEIIINKQCMIPEPQEEESFWDIILKILGFK